MTAPARLLLTEDEAAAELHISARTLRDLRKKGLIRYVAISARKIAYRPEDCAEYVSKRLRVDPVPGEPRTTRKQGKAKPVFGNVVPFSQRRKA